VIRTAHGRRNNAIRCAALILPAIFLSACQSREGEIAERNQSISAAATRADAARSAQQEQARLARLEQQQVYSQFYGHDEDSEGEEKKKKKLKPMSDKNEAEEEPDFLDPTSDFFDNTYAVPEPAAAPDAPTSADPDA